MSKKIVNMKTNVKIDTYKIISRAIEEGIQYGYRRAHKYVENPDENHIVDQIYGAIMNELSEILIFDQFEDSDS